MHNSTLPHEIAKRDLIEGLIKGIEVIQAFSDYFPRLTVTEIAERTGISRAAARRHLLTLVHIGLATCEGRHFRLTPQVAGLGSHLKKASATNNGSPSLQRLGPHLPESGNRTVLVLDGTSIVALDTVATSPG